MPHVRTTTARLEDILAEGMAASETLRDLVDTLQHSDVIVFISPQIPVSEMVWGELHFATSTPGLRYLRVRVRQDLSRSQLTTLMAHELHHAAEVAAAPEVVDTKTMSKLYERIGFEIVRGQYETEAALAVGDRVRGELIEYRDAQSRKH